MSDANALILFLLKETGLVSNSSCVSSTKDLGACTGRGLKPIGQNAPAADAQTRPQDQSAKSRMKTHQANESVRSNLLTTFLIAEVSKIRDGRSQAAFWSPRPHRIVSQVKWLEYLCTSATLVGEVNALRKLVGSSHRAQNITVLKTYLAKNVKNSSKSEMKYLQPGKCWHSSNIFYHVFHKICQFLELWMSAKASLHQCT